MALKVSIARSLHLILWVVVGCSGAHGGAERQPDRVVGQPPRVDSVASDAPEGTAQRPPEALYEPEVRAPVDVRPSAIRVAVVSDLNSSYGKTTYRDEVHASARWIAEELRPDLVLSTGDHVAGMKRGVDLDGMWAGFHGAFTDELERAGVPFAPTPGNHDASAYDAFAGERERYVAEWQGRRPEVDFIDDAHYPLRYAFRRGPALFVSLDVTVARELDDEQMSWLEGVFERGEDAPVKVVFGHIPLRAFVGGKKKDEVVRDARLEALFERVGVDAYLSGHHHAYYPGRAAGMRMVAMPCLGSGARRLLGTRHASQRGVVVLEIDASGVRSVESHTASSGFDEVVPRELLPERLGESERAVWRDDLSPTPALAHGRLGPLRRGRQGL